MHMFPIRGLVGFVAKFNRTTTGQIGKCNATPPPNNNNNNSKQSNNCNMSASLSHSIRGHPTPTPTATPPSTCTPPTPVLGFVLIDEWRGQSIKWPATTQICPRIQIQLQNTPTLCYPLTLDLPHLPPSTSHQPPLLPLPFCPLPLPSQPFFLWGVFWSCKLLFYDFIGALFPSSRQLISTSTWTLTIWPSVNPLQCVRVYVCMSVWGIGESETGENWESHGAVEQEIQYKLSTQRK